MNVIREQLMGLADEKYQKFSAMLIPNVAPERIMGVRIPELRKIAKQLAKQDDWQDYLAQADNDYFEEVMIQGMVIGYAKAEIEEILGCAADFIPKIDNWSICDAFCSGLKITKQYPEQVWDFIQPYLQSVRTYDIRFGVVMLLNYFVQEKYIDHIFHALDSIHHEDYYVKMSVAWCISMCYVKLPEQTLKYLSCNNSLDDFTYNKALQKTVESYQIDQLTKQMLKGMKRKRYS